MENGLRKAIISLFEDHGAGPIRGSKAAGRLRAFLEDGGYSPNEIRDFFGDAVRTLGPFDQLPESFRRGMAAAAEFRIREKNLLILGAGRLLAYGPLQKAGGHIIHRGLRSKDDPARSICLRIGRRIQREGRRLAQILIKRARYTPFYRAPLLYFLWEYTATDPGSLIQDYILKIPAEPRLSPVFKVAGRKTASCGLVGIDLLPSKGKLYFLESNFNPGHYTERHRLFPEGDTVCRHLVDWAAESGYTKVVFWPFNIQAVFDKELETAWHRLAREKGIQLEIVDDPLIGSPWPRPRRALMDHRAQGTLYVNGRYLHGPLARLIAEKGLMELEIRRFNEAAPAEAPVFLPRAVLDDACIPSTENNPVFPNIIVKNVRLDMTKGIALYKSRTLPPDANAWPNMAFEYVVPDLTIKEDNGARRGYIHGFRAYLLITPDGPVYLGARKDVASTPLPASLPFGQVENTSPYITSLYAGARSVPHSEKEDRLCSDAVLAIGRVIDRFLRSKYDLIVEDR